MSDIGKLASYLVEGRHNVALTGAGVCTLSGLPDFRSPGQKVWERFDRERVFDIREFRRDPGYFQTFANECIAPYLEVQPNAVHEFLSWLQEKDLLREIVTQNVDGLHQEAGSSDVIEIHGSIRHGHCLDCDREFDWEAMRDYYQAPPTPSCPDCGGVIKPDIVLYGEMLPMVAYERAMKATMTCENFVVLGSSLTVMPAAELPELAKTAGARLAILNRDSTPLDGRADVVLHGDLKELTRNLSDALKERLK